MEKQLPKGWVETTISEVGKVVTGNTPSKKFPEYYGGNIQWVRPGDIHQGDIIAETEFTLTEEGAKKARLIPKNSVMVTCIGNLGNVAMTSAEMATNQQINSIVFYNKVIPRFGYYWSTQLKPWLIDNSTSTTISMVNKKVFERAPFLLPPLAEQQRIVTKLDVLFAHLEKAKSSLAKVPEILKNFRQSVLTQAVTGKLTEEWREGKDVGVWEEMEIVDLVGSIKSDIRTGPFGSALKKSEHQTVGIPVWGIESIGKNGRFTGENKIFVSEEKGKELESFEVKGGDLIISRSGTIGEICILPDDVPYGFISTNLLKIVLKKSVVLPLYFCWTFSGDPRIKSKMIELCKGSTRLFITQGILKQLLFRIPSPQEQTEIVRRVESLFAKADAIEAQYQQLKNKIDDLPQAILAKAFKGELVEQLPTDGDAKDLLAEIQKLKAQSSNPKKTVKRKTKSNKNPLPLAAEPKEGYGGK